MNDSLFPAGAALVFGGSGGIGQKVAECFSRSGSGVAICYRSSQDKAERLATTLTQSGGSATIHKVDVTDEEQVKATLAKAVEIHGRVHTVVWGAGPLVEQVYLSKTASAQWRRALETEAFGFFNAVQASLPHMREAGGGSFVHLGSAGDRYWPRADGLSVAPKAVNEALIRGIAKEEGRFEIRANSVLIGVIEAGMFLELEKQGAIDTRWKEATLKLLALKRFGKPDDIGEAAVFLASSRANYITGQQISVSGGFGV
jgi:3-oxoacyl-[acyl-carrier protein] reductase